MSMQRTLIVAAYALAAVGLALLAVSGLFSPALEGVKRPVTDAQFLERTAAGLAFMLAYLCWFFTRKS